MDFTIVTPSRDQLEPLARCIASVADQEGVTIEHIVMDAGTEGFAVLAEEMRLRWPNRPNYRRVMVSEPDEGMYDAVNKGLRQGEGAICAYLNCDEQYLPCALAEVKAAMERSPKTGILYGGFLVVDEHGRLITGQKPVPLSWAHVATSHLPNFSCATFFRRTLLKEKNAYFRADYRYCADAHWTLERLREATPVLRIPRWVSVFVENGSNAGTQAAGLAEAEKIRASLSLVVKLLTPWWKWRHRLLKLFRGGYAWGKVTYRIFTRESPSRRVTLRGWIWPVWSSRLGLASSEKRG